MKGMMSMKHTRQAFFFAGVFLIFTVLSGAARSQEKPDRATEEKIVKYLRENVKPGEPLIVSDLNNKVFTSPEERKVLDRLFNTFFKIPLFIAQYKASTGQAPKLADISRQFNLPVEGEATVLLSIIDNDPRVPKFITRDAGTGEITAVDIEAVKKDRRFGQMLERSLAGFVGRDAAPFTMELTDGRQLASEELKGKNLLLYFWFTGCPPCVRIAPHMAELQKRFGAKNFTVVAVNADKVLELETTNEQIKAYAKKQGFDFPLGHLNKKMQESYGSINIYPTLFLINSKGVIQKQYVNYQALETLAGDVAAMVSGN
jgi:thiol-disulfide isomerase/thioredoxin